MNHLAHLFLAHETPESIVGNLSGDFVKGPLADRFPAGVRDGIAMHRRIDTFTDSHPATAATRQLLHDEFGHASRVIADVFFDHFLACDFARYSDEPLAAFLHRRFDVIDAHTALLPERLALVYPRMRDGRWFLSYATTDGVRRALEHIGGRLTRRPDLGSATHHLTASRAPLQASFHALFPDLIAYARAL